MPLPPSDLDRLADCLAGLVQEHERLLEFVIRHDAAIRAVDAEQIDALNGQQEQCRIRIIQAEARRRLIVANIVRQHKVAGEPTLARLAAQFPPHRVALLGHRDRLRTLATEISRRTGITARISQSLLGHLNTAVRLLAGAVERGGVYTKQGTPKITRRIGSLELSA